MSKKSEKPQYEERETTNYGAKQIDATLAKQDKPRFCLVDVDTGGGKTFMSIHAVGLVAPNAKVIVLTTKKQVTAKHWENSFDSYNEVTGSKMDYIVTNYDQLDNHGLALFDDMTSTDDRPLFLILDEAHKAKSTKSKRAKMIVEMSKLPNVAGTIALTATSIGNSLLDGTNYLIMAGFYRNKTQFNQEHVKFYDDHFQPIIKDRANNIRMDFLNNPQQIIDQLHSVTVQFDTSKLLPNVTSQTIQFEYDAKTQKAYRQIQRDYRNGVYDSVMTAISEQRNFVADHADQRDEYLSAIINSKTRPDDPILVFYQYVVEREHLLQYLKKNHSDYDIQRIDGETKKNSKTQGFPAPKNNKTIVLIQYQAGSEGLNASWCHTAIFYAPPVSWFKYKQAKGRNVRAYQKGRVYQFRFVVKKTINEHYWYDLIDKKQAFSSDVKNKFMEADD